MSVSKGVLSKERQLFITAEGQYETPEEHLSAEMVPSGYTPQQPHKCQATRRKTQHWLSAW